MTNPAETPSTDPGQPGEGVAPEATAGHEVAEPPFEPEVYVDLDADEAEASGEQEGGESGEGEGQPSGPGDTSTGAEVSQEEGAPESSVDPAEREGEPEDGPSASHAEEDGAEEEGAGSASASRQSEPFRFRVDGKRVEVPGAIRGKAKDGSGEERGFILIPEDAWQSVVQPRLVDRGAVLERERRLQAQLEEMAPEHHPDVVRARAIVELLDGEVLTSEESLRAFLSDFETRRDLLRQKVENKVLEAKDQFRHQRDTRSQAENTIQAMAQTITADLPQAVNAMIEAVGEGLPSRAAEAFRGRVLSSPERFYVLATEENAQALGLAPGQIGRNDQALLNELRFVLDLAAPAPAPPSANGAPQDRRQQAAATRARELGRKPTAPPTPTATAGQAPARSISSKEEWEKWRRS
jgi:hypothetical protein